MSARRRTRVIIDTDPGVDDALAILLALRSPELEVVAITTVCGNVTVEQATRNLFKVLGLLQRPKDLLIGQGAACPLIRSLETATHVHGADGLGDLGRLRNSDGSPRYPDPDVPRALPTAQAVWNEAVRRYPGEVMLITLGPLTNLASALSADSTLVHKLPAVVCMGGAIAVPGNVSPAAEFNIFVDPHAAQRVFRSGLPMTLIPLDITTQVALNRNAMRALTAKAAEPVCRFVGDATEAALHCMERAEGRAVVHLHDPLAVAVAIDPTLVRLTPLHVEVETDGQVTRGMTVADRRSLRDARKAPANVRAGLAVDTKRVFTLFRDRLCPR
jgi:purine nucleosidase/pyrimidine-specific ribonucleoside hydrolase